MQGKMKAALLEARGMKRATREPQQESPNLLVQSSLCSASQRPLKPSKTNSEAHKQSLGGTEQMTRHGSNMLLFTCLDTPLYKSCWGSHLPQGTCLGSPTSVILTKTQTVTPNLRPLQAPPPKFKRNTAHSPSSTSRPALPTML